MKKKHPSLNKAAIALLHGAGVLVALLFLAQVGGVVLRSGMLAAILPAELFNLTNYDRSQLGLHPLHQNPRLAEAAQLKANDMARRGYFSHTTPEGLEPWYWFDAVNYPYGYAGENLALYYTESKDVERAWMESPEHRANLLSADYVDMGIGVATGTYKGTEATFVVQFFGTKGEGAK